MDDAEPLSVSREQRETLERWIRASATPQQVALRARIVLMAADGRANNRVAAELGVSRSTVILWRERFARGRPRGADRDRPGPRPQAVDRRRADQGDRRGHDQTTPPGATHWSCRTMARAQGVSPATVQRIWDAHGLEAPSSTQTFKLSPMTRASARS